MSARCDECGDATSEGARRCARCGAPRVAPPEAPRYDGVEALAGWRLLQRATLAYAAAQLALTASGDARSAARLAVLLPAVAAPLWLARVRAGGWLAPWAALIGAGTLVGAGFLLTGVVPWGRAQGAALACSFAWSLATGAAAWRVRRGASRDPRAWKA